MPWLRRWALKALREEGVSWSMTYESAAESAAAAASAAARAASAAAAAVADLSDPAHASASAAAVGAARGSCSSRATEVSDEAIRKLADLVLSEIRSSGSQGGDFGRGLAEGGGDGGSDESGTSLVSAVFDSIASYGSMLLALLTLFATAKFAWTEYKLARSKYRDATEEQDDDSDDDDDDGGSKGEKDRDEGEEKGPAAVPFTWSELFWYRLDQHLSQSKWATPVLLLSVTGLLVMAGTVLLNLCSGFGLGHSMWLAWTYVADPGTHADAEGGAAAIAVSLLVTVGGMLVFAMVVGIVSDALGEKVHDLKKGRSRVIESDHTLMLGWTDKSLAIIQEVALANESEGKGTIVVLAEKDKEKMEETLEAAVSARDHPVRLLGTDVVFRSGNPLMENELDKVSASTARSIICLSPDNCDPDEADSRMVRQVLSLKEFESLRGHVVVEMQDVDNRDLINLVASDIAEVIVAHDMIGRLMIQCAREPGLANVLENLMGFDGAEFYFERWPALYGRTFLEITTRFDDAVPIGIRAVDGSIMINPENERIYKEGEKLLCLAEDDDTYQPNDGTYSQKCGKVPRGLVPRQRPEKLLFCGWRRDMADMITQLDEYVTQGSELWLFNEVAVSERLELLRDKGNKEELRTENLKILNAQGNPIVRRDLKLLKALRYDGELTGQTITLDEFDSVLILSESETNGEGSLSSDSRSLASLLLIQDIQSKLWENRKKGRVDIEAVKEEVPKLANDSGTTTLTTATTTSGDSSTNIGGAAPARAGVNGTKSQQRPQDNNDNDDDEIERRLKPPAAPISEILNTHTRSLLNVVNCQGYVMSNEIVSGAIAVVSEERDMNVVLGEILSAEGCETYIRDVSHYMDLGREQDRRMSFWDVALRARQRREVALGYKPAGMTFAESGELVLNPDNKMKPRVWEAGDKVIVFAFD